MAVDLDSFREKLDKSRFISPGPLWWAFNPNSARKQAILPGDPESTYQDNCGRGIVLFIPNLDYANDRFVRRLGRLLSLGSFEGPNKAMIHQDTDCFVILSSNEERELPDEFTRSCVALVINFPDLDGLIRWAEAVFPKLSRQVVEKVAMSFIDNRGFLRARATKPPGLGEFFDVLRVVSALSSRLK